jgi:hypothetical protein
LVQEGKIRRTNFLKSQWSPSMVKPMLSQKQLERFLSFYWVSGVL